MKKMLSIILAIVLLTVFYGEALADTLRLPGDLRTIEGEAFYNDPALDVVELPWGVERIESRAFAKSGLKRIYIPDTVYYIAKDAFSETNVIICAAEDSYAKQYADANGFTWEDSEGQDTQAAMDTLSDLKDEEYHFTSQQAAKMRLVSLDALSTDGITDADLISKIQAYNTQVASINEDIAAYNNYIGQTAQALEKLEGYASGAAFAERSGMISITTADVSMTVDKKFAEDAGTSGIESIDLSGGAIALSVGNGGVYYLYATDSNILLTENRPAAEDALFQPGAVGDSVFGNVMSKLVSSANLIVLDAKYIVSGPLRKLEPLSDQIVQKMKYLDYLRSEGFSPAQIELERLWSDIDGQVERAAKLQKQVKENQPLFNKLDKYSKALTSLSSLLTAKKIGDRFARITEIYGHGHPVDHDITPTAIDLSDQLRDKIRQLMILYVTEGIVVTAGLIGELVSLQAGPVATKAVDVLLNALLTGIDSTWMDNLYDNIIRIEDLLHMYVWGYVTDKDSKAAIEDLIVFTDEASCRTDKLGYYELYLPYDAPVTVQFSKEPYAKDGFVANVPKGKDLRKDMALTMKTGTVYGYVYDDEKRERLSGVTVSADVNGKAVTAYTGADGYYELKLPAGEEMTIIFRKDGYKRKTLKVTPVKDNALQRDMLLQRSTDIGWFCGKIWDTGIGVIVITSGKATDLATGQVYEFTTDYWGDAFKIELPKGQHTVKFETEQYAPYTATVEIVGGEETWQDVFMAPEGIPIDEEHFPDGAFRRFVQRYDKDGNMYLSSSERGNVHEINIGTEDMADCASVEGIQYFPVLQLFSGSYYNSSLVTLDLSDNPTIERVYINSSPDITALDLSNCSSLKSVSVGGCGNLADINLNGTDNLVTLECQFCRIKSLNVSGKQHLSTLRCQENRVLSSLNVTNCPALTFLMCYNNSLSSLSLSGTHALRNFQCYDNSLSVIDLRGQSDLEWTSLGSQRCACTIYWPNGEVTHYNPSND